MIEINKELTKIIKVGLFFNVIALITSLFYLETWVVTLFFGINLLLFGTYIILEKYFYLFYGVSQVNKIMGSLTNKLEGFN